MPDALTPKQRQKRSDRYAEQSRRKLQQAQQSLDKGRNTRATRQAYAALHSAARACGELRGWHDGQYDRPSLMLVQLAEENADPSPVVADQSLAGMLYNFCGFKYGRTSVQFGIDTAAAAVAKLEAIRQQPIPPDPDLGALTPEQRRRRTMLNQPADELPANTQTTPPNPAKETAPAMTAPQAQSQPTAALTWRFTTPAGVDATIMDAVAHCLANLGCRFDPDQDQLELGDGVTAYALASHHPELRDALAEVYDIGQKPLPGQPRLWSQMTYQERREVLQLFAESLTWTAEGNLREYADYFLETYELDEYMFSCG